MLISRLYFQVLFGYKLINVAVEDGLRPLSLASTKAITTLFIDHGVYNDVVGVKTLFLITSFTFLFLLLVSLQDVLCLN